MIRWAWNKGDRVRWPDTKTAAEDDYTGRSVTVEERQIILYPNGSPKYIRYLYDPLIDRITEDLKAKVENSYDNFILIDGAEGTGKSALAYHLARKYSELWDEKLDLKKSLIFTFEKLIDTILEDTGQHVYWLDELTNLANSRSWASPENKYFIKILEMIRSQGKTIIGCIPHYQRADVYIREFRTAFKLEAQEMEWGSMRKASRGFFELSEPTDIDDTPWRTLGYGRFDKMPPEIEAEYELIKNQSFRGEVMKIKEKMELSKQTGEGYQTKVNMILYMVNNCGLSYRQISEISGIPYSTVKNIAWKEHGKGLE